MPPNNGIEYFNMTSDRSRELLEGSTQTEESGTMTSFSDYDGIQIDSNEETEGVIERIARLFSTVRIVISTFYISTKFRFSLREQGLTWEEARGEV